MTDEEIEERFGLTREQIEELTAALEAGEIPGEPVGEIIEGLPIVDLTRWMEFERLLADWVAECDSIETTLADLRARNKVKTATYQQLTARKLALQSILGQCEERGLL